MILFVWSFIVSLAISMVMTFWVQKAAIAQQQADAAIAVLQAAASAACSSATNRVIQKMC